MLVIYRIAPRDFMIYLPTLQRGIARLGKTIQILTFITSHSLVHVTFRINLSDIESALHHSHPVFYGSASPLVRVSEVGV